MSDAENAEPLFSLGEVSFAMPTRKYSKLMLEIIRLRQDKDPQMCEWRNCTWAAVYQIIFSDGEIRMLCDDHARRNIIENMEALDPVNSI